jgi:DsbC/DsbD-like thiol-disulfide interchange protein
MSAPRVAFVGLIPILSALAATATNAQPQSRPKADISIVTDADGVHAGASSRVAVRASLPAGVHVQSNAPRDPFLIATTVTADATPGVSVVETVYPPASDFKQAGQSIPLAVYEQQFVVGVRLAIAPGTGPGELNVPIRVRYQACDANTCFPPATERLDVSLRVVPASVTPMARLKDVFDALRFRR